MSEIPTGTFRAASGWIRQPLSTRNLQGLKTDGQIDDELWILIEYYSEIESVGIKHLLEQGVARRKIKTTYKHFQGYIRQAKNYYHAAKQLHPRSAALLYYYCFLNLAKALIIQKNPEIGGKRISHGASCLPKDFTKIKKQTIKIIKDNGVFERFYEMFCESPIKKQSLSVEQLLSYCTDISYQSLIAGYGRRKVESCYYVNLVDHSNKTAWPLVGIPNFNEFKKYKKSLNIFFDKFELVEVPEKYAREYFQVSRDIILAFTFFQSRQTIPWDNPDIIPEKKCRNLVLESLGSIAQVNYFDDGLEFVTSLPYKINKQIPMNETIAIYLIMFYLSNLVRYNPAYLEELLTKKESWIIDSFIKSCSLTFLRAIISRITGTEFVIGKR